MPDIKHILTVIASVVAVISFIPYFLDIYRGITKPHAFSWLIWGILMSIGFAAQVVSDAGIAVIVIGINALLNTVVAIIGFYQGHVKFSRFDKLSLAGALLAIVIWQITKNPLTAVMLVVISDLIGYMPTFRKGYFYPGEETISTFLLGAASYLISIIALNNYSITNWLYPAVIFATNIAFVSMLAHRRKILAK